MQNLFNTKKEQNILVVPVKISETSSEYDLKIQDLTTASVKDGAVRIRLQNPDSLVRAGKIVTSQSHTV